MRKYCILGNCLLILILCIFLSSCVFLSWTIMGMETYCPWNPYIDTQFPELFNIDNLDKVKNGMEKPTVIELIGEPLRKSNLKDNRETYYYSRDGASKTGDWAWLQIKIEFQDSIVTDIHIEWVYD